MTSSETDAQPKAADISPPRTTGRPSQTRAKQFPPPLRCFELRFLSLITKDCCQPTLADHISDSSVILVTVVIIISKPSRLERNKVGGAVSVSLHKHRQTPGPTGMVSGSCSPRGGPRQQVGAPHTPAASSLGSAPQGPPKKYKYRTRFRK